MMACKMRFAMLTTMMSKLGVKGLVAGSVISLMPTAAFAHHHDTVHVDLPLPGPTVVVQSDCPAGRVWVAPVVQTVQIQQWVAPVYQTVTEQVYVPDTTATQNTQVLVPDQYGVQNVVRYDRRGNGHLVQQQVLISPAHYVNQPQTVVVPAHYEMQSHQALVTAGYYQTVPTEQVVVPGHWQTVDAPVVERVHPGFRVDLRLPF
jgi:hypothetical protein